MGDFTVGATVKLKDTGQMGTIVAINEDGSYQIKLSSGEERLTESTNVQKKQILFG